MMKTKLGQWVAALIAVLMVCDFWLYMPGNKVYADSQADALVSVALAEEGYTEGANNNNKYGAALGQNNVPWCALFISWCARQVGISESIIKTTAWAGDMGSNKCTGNFGGQYYPKGSITPQKGDIVYYDWNRNGSSDHVEIVISTSGSTFTSIGGNTTGNTTTEGVRRHSGYSFTSSYIVGFERPNYSTISSKEWYEGYSIIDLGTSFCATISNSTTAGYLNNEGWNVSAYPGNGQNNQAWIFNRQSDGSYTITSMLDTARLTTCNRDGSSGASIVVSHDGVDLSQKWYIYRGNKGYMLRPLHSDKVMDLDSGGYAAGTNIQLYEYNDTSSQYYNINKIDWRSIISPADIGTNFCAYIYNNTTGGYLDNEGWNVAAYPGTNGITQTWLFQRQIDGSYLITSLLDNARLSTYDGESNNNTSVVVSHDEINESQKWYIYKTSRGYILRPSHSDKVMDLEGGGYSAGTNIQLYEFNSTFLQYYDITKISHKYDSIVVNPICTEMGYTLHRCSLCQSEYKDTYVDAMGHNYIATKVVEPTFAEPGYTLFVCSSCGDSYKDNFIEKVQGDLNADNKFTISDAVLLQKWLLAIPNTTLTDWQAGDMNGNGTLNGIDLCLMKQALLAKSPS